MKQFIILLALLIGLQVDGFAQHYKRMQPVRKHPKASHHRRHHKAKARHRAYYRRTTRTVRQRAPSSYRGDNTPVNDGQRKNVQRNMNYNTNQPLPPSTGRR
jgi:hypothetical protein